MYFQKYLHASCFVSDTRKRLHGEIFLEELNLNLQVHRFWNQETVVYERVNKAHVPTRRAFVTQLTFLNVLKVGFRFEGSTFT